MTGRTVVQNGCYYDAMGTLAERLNDAGYSLSASIEAGLLKNEIPWTAENITDYMARPVMSAMWPDGPPEKGKWRDKDRPSTTELSTTEIQQVFDVIVRATGQKFGVTVDWPDRFNGGIK